VMKGIEKPVVKSGSQQIRDVKWIWHDMIGYLFSDLKKVNLTNQSQSGSWFKVNGQADSPKEEISKKVFKLWINCRSQSQYESVSILLSCLRPIVG